MTSKPTIFCNHCGAENPTGRGACLLCFRYLQEPGHGLPCPACGHDNPKEAQFCAGCGAPFAAGASRIPGLVDSALAVLHGGVAALTSHDEEYAEEDFLGGLDAHQGEEEAYAEPAAPVAPAPAPAPAPEPEPIADMDEDFMPPSALDLQAAAAPPVVEEEFVPPPPPVAVAEPAPLAPAVIVGDDDDDMMPPPPPPGLEVLEGGAPVAAAPAAPEPAPAAPPPPAAPAAHAAPAEPHEQTEAEAAGLIDPLAQASEEFGDEDFGDWSLDFPEEKKE